MFLGSRSQPVREAENLTAVCEAIFQTIWSTQHLISLYALKACYWGQFYFTYYCLHFVVYFEMTRGMSRSAQYIADGGRLGRIIS
jgi:uncharacterized membrane protein